MRYHDRLIFWALGVLLVLLAAAALFAQSATYPAGVVSFTTKTAGQTIQSAHINTLQAEVTAVENALLNGLAHVVKPLSDATYDVGTGAFRWRDGFFSRNVTIGGTLTAPALIGGWTVVTSTSTGTLNDFAPGLVGNTVVRMNNATLATITGFAGGVDGQLVEVDSVGAGQVDTAHQNTGSTTAADRLINVATSGNSSAAAGVGMFLYRYDGTAARWRLVAHEQGDWITPTYNGPDWIASAGSWTVDSGDVLANRYYLRGRRLDYAISVNTTSVSATPATLSAKLFGFTVAARVDGLALISDNGATGVVGQSIAAASGTTLPFQKVTGSWSTATNLTAILAQGTVDVQD